jgi:uncharacterized protein (DUF427 family)
MVRAEWKGMILAESDHVRIVEGNVYFPPESVRSECLKESPTRTVCPWKGEAHYYTVIAGEEENPDAAWYYPEPKPAAQQICNYVAFWKGVKVAD